MIKRYAAASLRAYTIIELLVVVAIMALLYAMIIIIPEESIDDKINASAQELKATLAKARSLAMRSGVIHGVTFNITNAGDGHVMKNFSLQHHQGLEKDIGGHWYAIIGPDYNSSGNTNANVPMWHRDNGDPDVRKYHCINDMIAAMKDAQIGERHYLKEGVRFLALTDTDYGNYDFRNNLEASYPRPWYGYYDSGRLHTWGGYDPDLDAAKDPQKPNSGFCYQGDDLGNFAYDADQDTIINTGPIYGRIDSIHQLRYNGDTVTPDTVAMSTSSTGQPRSLINGYWIDYMILFAPNGRAFTVWNESRWRLHEPRINHRHSYGAGEANHVDSVTGGFHVTLARDINPDEPLYTEFDAVTNQATYHKFTSPEDVLESITPFLRVFVHRDTGEILIKSPSHPDCAIKAADLSSKDPYPNK